MRILLGLLCAGILISCGDDEDSATPAGIEVLTRVGSTWTYDVVIEFFAVLDTVPVTVRVLDAAGAVQKPKPSAIWQISSEKTIDTSFVYVSGDTLNIVPNDYVGLRSAPERYVFPLAVGEQWIGGVCCGDTVRVTARDTITVPAGTFDTYRIERNAAGFNYHLTSNVRIKPDIGIVTFYLFENDLGFINEETWVMTGYVPAGIGPFRGVTPSAP